MSSRLLQIHGGQLEIDELGSGSPVVYLHGIWDAHEDAFVEELARSFSVTRLHLPGFGQSTGDEKLQDVHDAIYWLLDALDAAGISEAALIGHCLGGMLAAELAAVQPRRFPKLVLISPFGLWNGLHPTMDFFAASAAQLAEALHGPGAAAPLPGGQSLEEVVARAKAREVAARFLWPLPNRGLNKRIHRITMPTLLVWGSEDGITPPDYGQDFRQLIPSSELHVVQGAAHMPHLAQPQAVATLVEAFLK
ncbi:MAG TPA: alpha/beta hydrolase [Chloroflexota bacterium]|nr:alpha/beta hydrolase [Chloroflexota bacterium]